MAKEQIKQEKPLQTEKEPSVKKKNKEKPSLEVEPKSGKERKDLEKRVQKEKPSIRQVFKRTKKSVKEQTNENIAIQEIENILSQDMDSYYDSMSPDKKNEFKNKGEKTAVKIKGILAKAKIAVNKIINLIEGWLLVIPGVNKYFLEQEAKIKTQKILDLAKKKKNN